TRLQNGGRMHIALVVEELRHPDFLAQNSGYLCHVNSSPRAESAPAESRRLFMFLAKSFNLDVDAGRQIEFHQSVHGLLRGLENIEQALVGADLELLARFLVHVRGTQHAVLVFHRGQWNRARDLRAGAPRGIDNLTRGLVQDAVVIGLQPDANSLFSNHISLFHSPGSPGEKNWRHVATRSNQLLAPSYQLL